MLKALHRELMSVIILEGLVKLPGPADVSFMDRVATGVGLEAHRKLKDSCEVPPNDKVGSEVGECVGKKRTRSTDHI